MGKQTWSDNVDANGKTWKTIGDNIRYGAKGSVNQNEKTQLISVTGITDRDKSNKPVITFIDDDCRKETYSKLFPVIKEYNVPYCLACPINSLDSPNYMTTEQVIEMQNYGCEISCHHLKQNNMSTFRNASDYEKELKTYIEKANDIGLIVDTICYPQGDYVSNLITTVKKFFTCGFTVDRGVNKNPLETYLLKRVEVFPIDSMYNLEFVKKYIDNVENGWLILMTHSWYNTFNTNELKEIIKYINDKGLEIVSISEGLKRKGNLIETGLIQKPLEYISTNYFLVDYESNVYTNALTETQKSTKSMIKVKSGYNTGYNLTMNGVTPTVTDKKRVVSEKTLIKPNTDYLITGSNIYGNAIYVIYDENNSVIDSLASANTESGTVIYSRKITTPSNANAIRIASNLNIQPEMFSIFELRG